MTAQQAFYEEKLEYEIDSWDLSEALNTNDKVKVNDARSKDALENEHIPGSINNRSDK